MKVYKKFANNLHILYIIHSGKLAGAWKGLQICIVARPESGMNVYGPPTPLEIMGATHAVRNRVKLKFQSVNKFWYHLYQLSI